MSERARVKERGKKEGKRDTTCYVNVYIHRRQNSRHGDLTCMNTANPILQCEYTFKGGTVAVTPVICTRTRVLRFV